ncbi:hypothetical protein ACF0H5_019127 [Mactra antiquata]
MFCLSTTQTMYRLGIVLFTSLVTVHFYDCLPTTMVFDVVEFNFHDESITFVCQGSFVGNRTRWEYLNGPTGSVTLSYQNGTCTASPSDSFLSYSRYSYTCNSTVYQVTIRSSIYSEHNTILTCRDETQSEGSGSTWIVKRSSNSGNCTYCEPTLTFNVLHLIEGDNALFVCRVSSDVSYVNWNRNIGSYTSPMGVQGGQCITSPHGTFLDNTSEYLYTCNKTVYQVTRLNVQRSEHNDIYMCTPAFGVEGTASNWILNVKGPPRTSRTSDNALVSGIGEKLEIICSVTSYPLPSFTWWQLVSGQWEFIQNTEQMSVESSDLQSTLTITKVDTTYFTSYKVIAENSVGNMEEVYTLSHNGSPDVPTQLRYYEDLSTSSSIKLAWNPGYDGGSPQIFYIKYKPIDENFWKYKTVHDNGEQTLIFTLTGLKDTMYYYIIVLASNTRGNSTESHLLIANTDEIEHVAFGNLEPMIGGFVAGTVVLVVIAFTVGFFIGRNRASSGGCLSRTRPSRKQSDAGIANVSSIEAQFDNIGREDEYEMINQGNSPFLSYSTLQPDNNLTQNETKRDSSYENPT